MKNRLFYGTLGLFYLLQIASPCSAKEGSIQIKGSDTMVNLGQAWSEEFMAKNPKALIAITGGGSGTGIAALINNTCDIAQSSREMKPMEYDLAKKKGLNVQEVKVAIDAIAVVVHPSNPVNSLSVDQVADIFTGRIKNWKELGGPDRPLLVLSRDRNSGTHIFLLEHVLRKNDPNNKDEFAPTTLMLPSSQAIEQEIASNSSAIGYFGLGYLSKHVKAIGIKNKEGEAVYPSLQTVSDRRYLISRPLYFYLPQEPAGVVKNFIDFALSKEGQSVVLQMDFVPLKTE